MSGFFLGLVIEYLFVYTIAQSRTIPAQLPFLPHNLPPKTRTIFIFFPHRVRRLELNVQLLSGLHACGMHLHRDVLHHQHYRVLS